MKGEHLDRLHEQMVAALYGELPPEEEREFQARLAADAQLRAEWAELQSAHTFLSSAGQEDPAPDFVFLNQPYPVRSAHNAQAEGGAGTSAWRRLRAGWFAPAGGFALAAAVFVILIASGLRVDRAGNAWMISFGSIPAPALTAERTGAPAEERGIPLEPVVHTAESSAEPTTVSAESPEFVTREEYIASTYQLVQVLTNQLNDYDQRRTGEMALMMRGLQNTLEQRQERDREEMNARMEQFWLRAAGVRSLEGEESSPADSTGR